MHCRILDDNYSWKFIKRHIKLYIYKEWIFHYVPQIFSPKRTITSGCDTESIFFSDSSGLSSSAILSWGSFPGFLEVKEECACLRLPRLDYSRHFSTLKDRVNWIMISNEEQLKIVVLWYFFFHVGMLLEPKRKRIYKLLLRYVKRLKSQTSFLRLNYW